MGFSSPSTLHLGTLPNHVKPVIVFVLFCTVFRRSIDYCEADPNLFVSSFVAYIFTRIEHGPILRASQKMEATNLNDPISSLPMISFDLEGFKYIIKLYSSRPTQ